MSRTEAYLCDGCREARTGQPLIDAQEWDFRYHMPHVFGIQTALGGPLDFCSGECLGNFLVGLKAAVMLDEMLRILSLATETAEVA